VPVNGTQSFVREKGARPSGKGFVVKNLFKNIEYQLFFFGNVVTVGSSG